MPARIVAIWTGDDALIAATSCPPNAGFHAIRRPSESSRSMASPVSPAPSRAAARPATSRPHAVLGASTAHADSRSAQLGDDARDVLLDEVALDRQHLVAAPRTQHRGVRRLERPRGDPTVELRRDRCRCAEELPAEVWAIGFEDDADHRTVAAGGRDAFDARGVVTRIVERAASDEQLDGLAHLLPDVARAHVPRPCDLVQSHLADRRRAARPRPTAPRPDRRRARVRMRSAGTCARCLWVHLAGLDQTFGARRHQWMVDLELHPAVVVLAAQVQRARLRC